MATVGEVTRDFGVSKPTISRHLKMLEEAGVVSRVIDGRTHRLALRPDALAEASEWIESQRVRWERLFDVVGDYLEEQGKRPMTAESGGVVRIERSVRRFGRGCLRRLDEPRGDAALAPLWPGLGDPRGRGRSPGRR